ncbi:hypothetical protein QQ045_010783 [Rhodiola kirilowii]
MCFGGAYLIPVSVGSWSVQSSHHDIRDLTNSKWEEAPAEVAYMGRRLVHCYGKFAFHKICASANGVALSLAYQAPREGMLSLAQAPVATRAAISGDKAACLPQLCQGNCDDPCVSFPSHAHDDGDVCAFHDRPVFQDDNFI